MFIGVTSNVHGTNVFFTFNFKRGLRKSGDDGRPLDGLDHPLWVSKHSNHGELNSLLKVLVNVPSRYSRVCYGTRASVYQQLTPEVGWGEAHAKKRDLAYKQIHESDILRQNRSYRPPPQTHFASPSSKPSSGPQLL